LISAFQCARIDLLQQNFTEVHIPSSAIDEFRRHGVFEIISGLIRKQFMIAHNLNASERLEAGDIVKQIAASPLSKDPDFQNHLVEAEAIVLMERHDINAHLILLDELAAREIAFARGLTVSGFVGVLIISCQDGTITAEQVGDLLRVCQRMGTHYSNRLIETVVNKLTKLSFQTFL
jgi:predicted nucleic acid-binding protein